MSQKSFFWKTDDQNQTQRIYPDQQHSQHISQTVPTQDHSQAEYPQHSYQEALSQDYPEEEYVLSPMQAEYLELYNWIFEKDEEQGNLTWPGRNQAKLRMHSLWDEIGRQEQSWYSILQLLNYLL